MVAKTFKGLEEVLRDELIALGAQNVEIGQRMVSFEGGLEMLYKANLCCRTAQDTEADSEVHGLQPRRAL